MRNLHWLSGIVLDVGADRQPYRAAICSEASHYLATDFQYRLGLDFLSSATNIPLSDESVDSIVMTEVLEHVSEPWVALREAYRVLRPGGVILVTTPQTWGLHGEPHDYYRFTRYGLEHLITREGFDIEHIESYSGTIGAAGARIADGWAEFLLPKRSLPLNAWGLNIALIPVGMLVWVPVNIASQVLDTILPIRYDPIGHIAIARKPTRKTVV